MSDDLAEITITLPVTVIDRLRGSQSREGWLEQAALELARRQSGHDPLEPVSWWIFGGASLLAPRPLEYLNKEIVSGRIILRYRLESR
jgi:hypothetical protein